MNIARLKKFIVGELTERLSDKLSYHGLEHTLAVLENCNRYIRRMKISPGDAYLLRTAALMHDTGFMQGYDNHEELSVAYSHKMLPEWNYSPDEIETICSMIMATRIPQHPKSELEKVLADSDLDYLGTSRFLPVGERLFRELRAMGKLATREEWGRLQVGFLLKHRYHTPFAQKYREPVKQKHLEELLRLRNWTVDQFT